MCRCHCSGPNVWRYPPQKKTQITDVIKSTTLPLILYNNPAIHHNTMLPISIIEEFSEHPQLTGIKNSAGDWDYFEKLLNLQSADFSVFQGSKEALALRSLNAGADGIVAGVANVDPSLVKQLINQRQEKVQIDMMNLKAEIKGLSADSLYGYKQKLVQLGVIKSVEMFNNPG